MKLRSNLLLLLTIVSFVFFTACEEKENNLFGSISGIVTDVETSEPIQGITVTLVPGSNSAVTGNDGIYYFTKAEAGQYTLQFKGNGYQTNTKIITVEPYKTATGDMQLSPGSGNLGVDKSTLEFGTSDNYRMLHLKNTGKSSFDWEIKYNCSWIKSVTPSSGTIKPGVSNVPVTIEIDRSKLANTEIQRTNFTISTNDSGGMDVQVSVNGSSSGGQTPALTNGLMAYYNFDNDNAEDTSDSSINGILINSPEFITNTPNGEGKALSIKAADGQYLSIPKNPLATSSDRTKTSSMSICFWIKDFSLGQIFSSINDNYLYACPYFYFKNDAFNVEISTSGSGYYTYDISFEQGVSQFQNGKWHHVAYVMEDNLHTLYINGQYYGGVNPSAISLQYITINAIHFGGNAGLKDRTATNMKLDNIRFYNRSLSITDVKIIYNTEKS
ncbi:MAG: LamG-like jellyroll fold domain-containing protein [Dysgonomonas sp.]